MRILLAVGVACLVVGCSQSPPVAKRADPPKPRLTTETAGLTEMTDGWYQVSHQLAMLCSNPSPEVLRADRQKHGPHSMRNIRVYMNPAAETAFRKGQAYPAGALVLKAKWDGSIGAMVKRKPGFDDLHGDWEFYFEESGSEPKPMPARACADCHSTARSTDHVFATWHPSKPTLP